jgi:hypothetical protein
MWVLKRKEGSVNYIVIWAIVALLLVIAIFSILSYFFLTGDQPDAILDPNTGLFLLVMGLVLFSISVILAHRQFRQLARLQRLEGLRNNVRSGLRLAESMGVDTQRAADLYKIAEAKASLKNLKKTEKTMAECNAILESQLTLYSDKLLEKTKARMELKRDSTGILFSNDSLRAIEKEIEKANYWEVSRLLRSHRIATERIEGAWFGLKKAKRLGIKIDREVDKLKEVLKDFNKGDLVASRIGAIRVRDSLDARIVDHVKERYVRPVHRKINLMEGKGIVSEDAERMIADAGSSLLAANIESSLKLARTGDELINEAAKGSIEESFEKVEGISDRAARLGVNVDFVPARIDIARDDLENGRLEKSLEVLRNTEISLVKNMNFLVVEQLQAMKKSTEMLFLVPEAKLELDTQLEEVEGERKAGNFEEAIKLARKLSERVKNEEKESLRAFRSSTKKLQKKVRDLEAKGVATEKIHKAIEVSGERVAEKNFANAMEIILNVTEIVNRNLSLHKDSVRRLEELSTLLTRTKEQGVDVSDLVKMMEALEGVTEPEKVLSEAGKIEEQALKRMTDMTERTHVELAKMRDQLHSLLETGVDVGDAPKLMGEAEKAVKEAKFTKADKIVAKASKELEGAMELSERFDYLLSQITETFVTLERAGIPTSVFESDLQHLTTERNEDSLEELTRFLDEVQSEKERMKSQAREAIEDSNIMVSENPDITFEEENAIIARATDAYDNGKFSQAFEIAVEAVGRTRKKVELYELSNELSEGIEKDIERLGQAGFDVAALESELQLCDLEGDPTVRLEKVRALEAQVDRTETRLKQKMEWAIVEARHGISLLELNEVSSEDLTEMLDSAQELVEDEKYRDAEKKARNVRNLAKERVDQFREAKAKMYALEHIMARAREMEVSLEQFEDDFSWLQGSDDYSHMIEKAGLMHDQINNLFEDQRGGVRESISRMKNEVSRMEGSGIRAPSVLEAIEKAELEMSEDRIIEAMDTINLAEKRIEEVESQFERWSEVVANAENALKDATDAGIGVKDFVMRLDALKESGDYESAIPEVDRILDDLNSRKTTMTSRSLEDIQETREKLETLIEEGAPAGELLSLLKDAERSVQEEEYTTSRQKILEVVKATDQMRKDHESFTMVLQQVKAEVDEVSDSGLDMSEIFDELEAVRNSEDDYGSRIQLVRDLGVKASGIAESLGQEASQVMSEVRGLVEDMKAKRTGVEEAEKLLTESEIRMGEGNTFEAKRLALEAKTILEEIASLERERNGEYARAKDAINKAAKWGVDVSSLRSDLDSALHLASGQESVQMLRVIVEEADSLRLSLSEDAGARLDGLRMEVQDMKGKGIPVSNLDTVIRSAEQMMSDGKLEEANELIVALEKQKSELAELWSVFSDAKAKLSEEMAKLEVRRIDMETIQKENAAIDSLGVTTEAVEKMQTLTKRVAQVKTELRESTETRLGEVRDFVNRLSEEGADVEEATSVLYEAEEVLAEDSYLKALAKINRAADLGDKIEKKHAFSNKILETEELLKVANEEGAEVSDLMLELENLRNGDDFEKMTKDLDTIEEETNRRRNGVNR